MLPHANFFRNSLIIDVLNRGFNPPHDTCHIAGCTFRVSLLRLCTYACSSRDLVTIWQVFNTNRWPRLYLFSLLDKLLCRPSISFLAREILKRESRDCIYTMIEVGDIRNNQNRYYTFATTHAGQVPAPLGSVKTTNSETTSRCGTSFFGLCNGASHACCVLQASRSFNKTSAYHVFGEYRKSCGVLEHRYIMAKDGESLIARHIFQSTWLITICWRLSVAVASAWRMRSIYSCHRALWHKHHQDKHKIMAKNGKLKGLVYHVTECLRLGELRVDTLNEKRQVVASQIFIRFPLANKWLYFLTSEHSYMHTHLNHLVR